MNTIIKSIIKRSDLTHCHLKVTVYNMASLKNINSCPFRSAAR